MSDIRQSHPSAERLQAFLDGDLPAREKRRIEEHLAGCVRCAEDLASWQDLFQGLDSLGTHGPAEGFSARVMAGVLVPERLPLAARVRAGLSSLLPSPRPEHPVAGVLQDFVDGAMGARAAARVQAHLDGCPTCASEVQSWSAVLARLSDVDRFAPRAGFADAVMAGLAPLEAPATVRRPAWAPVLAGARRLVPSTRRAWAALAGAAVTPAVTFALVLYAVFSHPTLTPQALASFAFWQLTDLALAGWSALLSGSLAVARFTGLDGLLQTLVDQPLVAAAGLAVYGLALVFAIRVLYKNLIDSQSLRPRYASAS